MAYIQNGVLEKSKMYFSSLPQNKDLFFYPISAGHFYCNQDYLVERDNFESILITYVIRGSLSFVADGAVKSACSGELALIDCFNQHRYYANDSLEAYWVHISGSNTYELYKEIVQRFSCVISVSEDIEEQIKDVYSSVKNSLQLSESAMSLKIYKLLSGIFNCSAVNKKADVISGAVEYVSKNYDKCITVNDIAKSVHLSKSQFSRNFKKQTGTSPYEYLLSVRLTKAKELLKNTSLPINEIAYRTGFASDSNFIYFFKKQEGISPLKFRNILF